MTAKRRKSIPKKKTLEQLYAQHRGKVSDKWSAYLTEYERILGDYRNKPLRLLEIGVQNGGSLEIWSRFFPKARKIVGCDINPHCARLRYKDPRVAVVVGDANSDAAQGAILGHAPTFDIIIDDGSHRSSDIVKSFARYFPCLADGGVYIVEDLHCSYWRKFEGGLYDPFSSLTFFKGLTDAINHAHWGIEKSRADILRGFFSKYGFHMSEEALQSVHSVQFMNSLCVVRKENPERNRLNARVFAGSAAIVEPEVLGFHSRPTPLSDQTSNEWTARSMPPGEELPLRINELAKRDAEAKDLAAKLQVQEARAAERDGHIAGLHQTVTERDGQIAGRDAEIVRLKSELAAALSLAQEKLAALEAEREAKNQQIKTLEEKAARFTKQLSTSSRRIQMLVEWMESLEHVISALLSSRRWKTGNMLGELRRRLLLKPRVTMPVDILSDVFGHFNAWKKNYQKEAKKPPDRMDNDKRPISPESSASGRNTRWQPVLSPDLAEGLAKLDISVTYSLSNIDAYKRQIAEYLAARARRTAQPSKEKKIVIYTAISGNYDSFKLPERPDPRFDYVLFTDGPAPDTGVYQVRPITYLHVDPTRAARFVKTHPHMLLDGYDIAIWIDSNIMILEDIYPLVEAFLASGKAVAAIPHPHRKSIYEELEACILFKHDNPEIMREQLSHYRSIGFDHDDLIESNLMMLNLRDDRVRPLLDAWWREIDRYSKRDQLSLNYALKQTGIAWHRLTEHPNSVRNHAAFAFVPHDSGDGPASKLINALQVSVVDPYAGPPYADIRDQRIAAQKHRKIDIVVCVHNALEDVKLCLESIRRARNSEHQRLIIINDGSDQPTARYLEDFANSAPWIELHRNRQPRGYPKAANQGLAASTAELVILLNSDTIVTNGWAEKMVDAVFSTPGAGIVGPMSNAASHQSIPDHRSSKDQTAINELPPGLTAEDMNRYCEQWTTADVLPRVPLVHGFCFGVTREVLNRIGYFDEDSFPKGYGEENDYCFRAADAGFSLVVATHTYIFHAKSKSYATPDRVPLMKAGSETLKQLHGRARIERAVRSMQENPLFVDLRQRAGSLRESASPSSPRRTTSGGTAKSSVLAVIPLRADGHWDGTTYIRVLGPLRHHSLSRVLTLSLADRDWGGFGPDHDALLIQRDAVKSPKQAKELVERCRKKKIRLIYEIDDDLLHLPDTHPAAGHYSPTVKEAMQTIAQHAHAVVVSTAPLKELMTTFNRNVFVVPNALDESLWRPADGPRRGTGRSGQVKILYMGTRTHDDDLTLVIDAIKRVKEKYGDRVTFTCIGVFSKNPPEMVRVENVPKWAHTYPEFAKWMVRSCPYDIAIGPLVENDFNRHKSYIKYLDYGICGFAPVLSNVQPYREVVRHNETAVLVTNTPEHWFDALCALIEDPALRGALGRNARDDVLAHHTLATQAEQRQRIWNEILHGA